MGTVQPNDFVVGIDLGTTNSLVAIIDPKTAQPIVLREFDQTSLVPSILHFTAEGEVIVGEPARAYLRSDPAHTVFSAKRLMGKSFTDIQAQGETFPYEVLPGIQNELVNVRLHNQRYTPIELSAFILRELKKRAEHILQSPVNKAVITVPAYFNDTQRQATRDAGKLAGLNVLRIINEPTAAALAYGLDKQTKTEQLVAVYDLGGGTFDVSILRLSDGVFEVLSTSGDTRLGGDDIDNALAAYITQTFAHNLSSSETLLLAQQAKKHLSTHAVFTVNEDKHQVITRADFERCIQPFIDRSLGHVERALRDASLSTAAIEEILLVGGSTRIPAVQQAVGAFFAKAPNHSLHPDEVVALGAAIQADVLAGNNTDVLLLDVTPLSLGIETMGGLMDVLVARNTKIPTQVARSYTTQKDGQTGIRISVYQGERDLVADNRELGAFSLKGIPPMPAGLAKVEVRFFIDADGILRVQAQELRSGVQQEIVIEPKLGMSDEQIEQMLNDSITHAQADIQARALIEARTEAQQLYDTTQTFLHKHGQFLTQQETLATTQALTALHQQIKNGDKEAIVAATERVQTVTTPYAERVMNMALRNALEQKNPPTTPSSP